MGYNSVANIIGLSSFI